MIPISVFFKEEERDIAILHIDPPYKHARHLVVAALPGRLKRLVSDKALGRGSALAHAAVAAGSALHCTSVLYGATERRARHIRRHSLAPALCPLCSKQHFDHKNVIGRDARLTHEKLLAEYVKRSQERYDWERQLLRKPLPDKSH